MNADEQRALAAQLAAALDAAGLRIEVHHDERGRSAYLPADLVSVVGYLVKGHFYLRDGAVLAPPVVPPRLLVFPGERGRA